MCIRDRLDDENWHVLTVSHRDRKTGQYTMEKAPCYHLVEADDEATNGATKNEGASEDASKVLEPAE